ncbi:MAG: hypothetical protein QOH96_1372 [Blastocatellia bacterium]|nr:hypothetical protein [Blastocatellia bacterium]
MLAMKILFSVRFQTLSIVLLPVQACYRELLQRSPALFRNFGKVPHFEVLVNLKTMVMLRRCDYEKLSIEKPCCQF